MTYSNTRGVAYLPAIFIVIALVAAAGVGYVLIKQPFAETTNTNANVVVSNTNTTSSNTNAAVNTNASVSIAGWKTYTNTFGGFSFKYPADWGLLSDKIQTTGAGISGNALTIGVKGSQGKIVPGIQLYYDPLGFGTPGADLQYTLQRGSNGFQVTKEAPSQKMVPDSTTFAIQASEPDTQSKAFFMTFTQSTKQKDTWPGIVKSILSTFTFTSPTAGWKTYTNTKYGFSIKYPSTWGIEQVNSTSLDGKPLIFTQLSGSSDKDGAIVISYLNSPSLFQDGKWDPSTGQITNVGGRAATSTVYTPDLSTPWAVKPTPKEKIVFTVEPSGWVNRGTAKDVNGNTYEWGNGDIQLLSGTTGKFDVLNTILSTFTFTK